MEDLTASLSQSFQVTKKENSTSAQHPKFSEFYKAKSDKCSQNERRQHCLDAQKRKRERVKDLSRRLAENDWAGMEEDDDDDEDAADEEMDTSAVYRRKYFKVPRRYRDQLMLSEWLVDVPVNLDTDWIGVVCPQGKRCLVVTSTERGEGVTRSFGRNGYQISKFRSLLPGGCRKLTTRLGGEMAGYTILDCVLSVPDQTYYVLDLMCWNGYEVYDSETEFRFYWLESKLNENPDLSDVSSINPWKFVRCPRFSCDRASIEKALEKEANSQMDGLLFYHKRCHYTFGATPLVSWLKPYMAADILGVHLPSAIEMTRPPQYTNQADAIRHFDEDRKKLADERYKKKERSQNNSMETNRSEDAD